ncbi:hypothetical protein LOTGIDRAFT_116849 [Lottia gigantea]|uniref:Cytochrome P450 n=1 Tax=Lottia gigantea TaxID=225164 RepID=V4AF72_LOTGI|nr:hypothetical protein LOTGIDRAFT_116849 [Lottia gigantea]ESO95502.1 hypothetical protein LOTGIDRAFT_116849 [Lottia gigantea]
MEFPNSVHIPTWILVTSSTILSIYLYSTWPYSLFKSLKIPGPKPVPFLGNIHTLTKQGMHVVHGKWVKEFGKVVGYYEGRHPCLLISDPAMLKEILVKKFNSFRNRRVLKIAGYPMDDGILQQTDNQWKNTRTTLTPTFSSSKLKQMSRIIEDCVDDLIQNSDKLVEAGQNINLKNHLSAYTMDVIACTAFGVKINAYNPEDPFLKNAQAFTKLNFAGLMFMTYFLAPWFLPVLLRLNITVVPQKPLQFFIQTINGAIEARKSDSNVRTVDILKLSSIVRSCNGSQIPVAEGFTNSEILGHSVTFFLAGHETTAAAMTYLAYNLALHTDIQQKVLEEIDKVLKKKANYENIQKLEYLDMCLSESLRLYPPSIRLERQACNDVTIGEITIPKDTIIVIPTYTIHRDETIFPDPGQFNPERFSDLNKSKIPSYCYFPFGLGPRSCIGMRMAILEVKLGMVGLLQKYKFSTCDKTMVRMKTRYLTKGRYAQCSRWLFDKFVPFGAKSKHYIRSIVLQG